MTAYPIHHPHRNHEQMDERWEWSAAGFLKNLPDKHAKACPSDIDGFMEINNNYLVIETKYWDGMNVRPAPYGQRLALNRLASEERFNVIYIYGPKDNPLWVESLKTHLEWDLRPYDVSARVEFVADLLADWANHAAKN
jgi:hypothetical protein